MKIEDKKLIAEIAISKYFNNDREYTQSILQALDIEKIRKITDSYMEKESKNSEDGDMSYIDRSLGLQKLLKEYLALSLGLDLN